MYVAVVIVVLAYYHIQVDASNHYAPEPSVVFPTVCGVIVGLEPISPALETGVLLKLSSHIKRGFTTHS